MLSLLKEECTNDPYVRRFTFAGNVFDIGYCIKGLCKYNEGRYHLILDNDNWGIITSSIDDLHRAVSIFICCILMPKLIETKVISPDTKYGSIDKDGVEVFIIEGKYFPIVITKHEDVHIATVEGISYTNTKEIAKIPLIAGIHAYELAKEKEWSNGTPK